MLRHAASRVSAKSLVRIVPASQKRFASTKVPRKSLDRDGDSDLPLDIDHQGSPRGGDTREAGSAEGTREQLCTCFNHRLLTPMRRKPNMVTRRWAMSRCVDIAYELL